VPPTSRDTATLAATVAAVLAGAHIVRVHAVRPTVEAVSIADAILRSETKTTA
jgi:dihydropteroate synthase